MFAPILAQARDLINSALTPGDTAVDATVGNGHDMSWLSASARRDALWALTSSHPPSPWREDGFVNGLEERVELLFAGTRK